MGVRPVPKVEFGAQTRGTPKMKQERAQRETALRMQVHRLPPRTTP